MALDGDVNIPGASQMALYLRLFFSFPPLSRRPPFLPPPFSLAGLPTLYDNPARRRRGALGVHQHGATGSLLAPAARVQLCDGAAGRN